MHSNFGNAIRFTEYQMQTKQILSGGKRLNGDLAENKPDLPLVTVITAVFNAEAMLDGCLQSVLSQDYPNIEHIIVDGASTDGTLSLLRRYESQIALWISEPDKGVYDAWNKGVALARGEWIAFLGADDIYLPGAVSTYMELSRRHPGAEFLSSRAKLDHPTGYSPTFGGPWEWPRFATAMTTIHVGTFHHRELFRRYGSFNIAYRIAGDFEFMLRAKGRLKTAFTPETTVIMRAGGVSDSTAGLYEAKRAKIEAGVRTPLHAEIELRRAIVRFHARRVYLSSRARMLRSRG
jgi:glycosyltransferase involved in cell wall biosynthesis